MRYHAMGAPRQGFRTRVRWPEAPANPAVPCPRRSILLGSRVPMGQMSRAVPKVRVEPAQVGPHSTDPPATIHPAPFPVAGSIRSVAGPRSNPAPPKALSPSRRLSRIRAPNLRPATRSARAVQKRTERTLRPLRRVAPSPEHQPRKGPSAPEVRPRTMPTALRPGRGRRVARRRAAGRPRAEVPEMAVQAHRAIWR